MRTANERQLEVIGDLFVEGTVTTKTEPGSVVKVFSGAPDDATRSQWMRLIETSPGFSFWDNPEEDVYTYEDGDPI